MVRPWPGRRLSASSASNPGLLGWGPGLDETEEDRHPAQGQLLLALSVNQATRRPAPLSTQLTCGPSPDAEVLGCQPWGAPMWQTCRLHLSDCLLPLKGLVFHSCPTGPCSEALAISLP